MGRKLSQIAIGCGPKIRKAPRTPERLSIASPIIKARERRLELELQPKLERTRIAREGLIRPVKDRVAGGQVVRDASRRDAKGPDVVQRPRNKLRVVKNVERVRGKLDLEPFRD